MIAITEVRILKLWKEKHQKKKAQKWACSLSENCFFFFFEDVGKYVSKLV